MAFTIVGDAAVVSGNCSNSRKAAVFTGGNTDDCYSCDTFAAARCAANDTAGTITAWVCPGDVTSTVSIFCLNDNNVVEFIDFRIAAGKLTAVCTDATVAQWSITSPAINIPAHVWTHVALVHDGFRPYLYVNGVKVVQTDTVATTLASWISPLDGVDNGSIGAGRIAGDASITEEFVGAISDVKYWASALTDAQIIQDATQGGYITGAVAWWDMDSLVDQGSGATNLTAVSDVYMTPTYNEFISRVRKFGAVVADVAGFCENQGRMSVMFINAA